MVALLLAATVVTGPLPPGIKTIRADVQTFVDCSLLTPQQRQGLNCVPDPQPQPNPVPPPPTTNQPNPNGFQLGHTYRRTATGTRIYIMGLGQDVQGFFAYTAQCLDENTEDHCYARGFPLLVYAHLGHIGWEDLGPYPGGFQF